MAAEERQAAQPQHLQALAQANAIRLERARIKRDIRAGKVSVCAMLEDPPASLKTMTVAELLRAQRRWGRTRSATLLSRCGLSEARRLGRLTLRQRSALIDALGGRG
jgi:hypothetical protein